MTLDEAKFCAAAERIGIAEAVHLLANLMTGRTDPLPFVTIAEIQRAVARHYRIPLADMESARRSWIVSRPRQVAMYLSKHLTPRSLPEIGRCFGKRDHTTVMHAISATERRRHENADLDRDIRILTAVLAPAAVQSSMAPGEH